MEGIGEGSGPSLASRGMGLGRFAGPQQGAKTARIVEPGSFAVGQLDIHVIVLLGGCRMSSTRRLPDILRWRMAVPKSVSSNRYLARRLTGG